jgi:hypothetical protein
LNGTLVDASVKDDEAVVTGNNGVGENSNLQLQFRPSISAVDLEVCSPARSDGRTLTQSRFADCGDALHHGTRLIDAHFICEHALSLLCRTVMPAPRRVTTRNLQSELTQCDSLHPRQRNPISRKPNAARLHHVV